MSDDPYKRQPNLSISTLGRCSPVWYRLLDAVEATLLAAAPRSSRTTSAAAGDGALLADRVGKAIDDTRPKGRGMNEDAERIEVHHGALNHALQLVPGFGSPATPVDAVGTGALVVGWRTPQRTEFMLHLDPTTRT